MDESKDMTTQYAGDDDDDQPANPFAAFVYKGAHGASSETTVNSHIPKKARVRCLAMRGRHGYGHGGGQHM